jgi:hypothetical protein
MALSFTVKLPDGNEYGPVDLATLRSWHDEGRIGPDTWVWPEGSPEWFTLIDVLAGAGQAEAGSEAPLKFKEDPPVRGSSVARPSRSAAEDAAGSPAPRPGAVRPAPTSSGLDRRTLVLGGGLLAAVVLGFALGLWLWLPRMEKQRAGERIQADAVPERRLHDGDLGLVVAMPEGWVLLKPETTVIVAPQVRAKMAHPALGAFATLTVEPIPPGVLDLDVFLDRVLDGRRALVRDYRELARADAALGGRPARRRSASWVEDRTRQKSELWATRDAWSYVALAAWGPESGGPELTAALEGLARAVEVGGVLQAKVRAAADALAPEQPELSRASIELILCDRLGNGGSPAEVGATAVRAVSQGLGALTKEETWELQHVYGQVYDPMPEADRQRLAAWQREARAGRAVAAEEGEALRVLLRDALLALPEEARTRLQTLNEKAIAASYALR